MLTLVKNEWIKLAKKYSTWVMLLLLALSTVGVAFITRMVSKEAGANTMFQNLNGVTSFLNLFVVVVAASSVAEEFTRGTIKFLLIRPYSRSQILFAKFITCMLYSLLGTVILFITALAADNLLLKTESPLDVLANGNGHTALAVALVTAATNLLLLVLYVSMTLFISAVIRSQSLAVGLGVGMLFGSTVVNQLMVLAIQKYEWLKWNPFNMLNIKDLIGDLLGAKELNPSAFGSDLLRLGYWEMAGGLVVYAVVIYFLTNFLFNKRDVALS